MTREEALKELDQLSRAVKASPVSQREVLCPEMREAARIQSVAFERVRKRNPLYGNIRRTGLCHRRPGVCHPPDGGRCCARGSQTFARMLNAFCPSGDRKRFLLARTLLQAGINDAQDWH